MLSLLCFIHLLVMTDTQPSNFSLLVATRDGTLCGIGTMALALSTFNSDIGTLGGGAFLASWAMFRAQSFRFNVLFATRVLANAAFCSMLHANAPLDYT